MCIYHICLYAIQCQTLRVSHDVKHIPTMGYNKKGIESGATGTHQTPQDYPQTG